MINAIDPASIALQPQALGSLRYAAKNDPEGSMRAVAQQFESMFVGIMLKSMRSATPGNSLFDNEQSKLYTELRDQQLAQKIATTGKGLGLADMLLAQMKRLNATAPEESATSQQAIPLHREAPAIAWNRAPAVIPLNQNLPGSDFIPLPAQSRSGGAA